MAGDAKNTDAMLSSAQRVSPELYLQDEAVNLHQ